MPRRREFDIEKIAAIVMESIDLGLPLAPTVMAVMDVDASRARYMVRAVRDGGHIGARPHLPARAIIHRGSKGEKSWIVCQHCTTSWPCPDAFPYGSARPTPAEPARTTP